MCATRLPFLPCRRRTSPMRMRSTSAPRSRTPRATTPRRCACWKSAWPCAGESDNPSRPRQRSPRSPWPACTPVTPPRARESEQEAARDLPAAGRPDGRGDRVARISARSARICRRRRRARVLRERCLVIARNLDARQMEAECERMLGELALEAGDLEAARGRFARSLEVCRRPRDKRDEAMALWSTGKVEPCRAATATPRASGCARPAAFRTFEMNSGALRCLEDYAALLQLAAVDDDATRLYAAASMHRGSGFRYRVHRAASSDCARPSPAHARHWAMPRSRPRGRKDGRGRSTGRRSRARVRP